MGNQFGRHADEVVDALCQTMQATQLIECFVFADLLHESGCPTMDTDDIDSCTCEKVQVRIAIVPESARAAFEAHRAIGPTQGTA